MATPEPSARQSLRIGIIGAGMIGGTLGRLWMNAGHQVRFGTRHPERVALGTAVSARPPGTARWAQVLLLAVPLNAIPELASAIGPHAKGKVVVDACNAIASRDPDAARDIGRTGDGSGVWVSRHFPSSLVVKAFNTVFYRVLAEQSKDETGRPGIPIASDDPGALDLVSHLVEDAGLEAVVVGKLIEARRFDVGTPLWNSGANAETIRRALRS